MAKRKPNPQKKTTVALPPGVKASTRKISPALRKLLMEDRAIASGGRNTILRKSARPSR
jgi:hypothetical protein